MAEKEAEQYENLVNDASRCPGNHTGHFDEANFKYQFGIDKENSQLTDCSSGAPLHDLSRSDLSNQYEAKKTDHPTQIADGSLHGNLLNAEQEQLLHEWDTTHEKFKSHFDEFVAAFDLTGLSNPLLVSTEPHAAAVSDTYNLSSTEDGGNDGEPVGVQTTKRTCVTDSNSRKSELIDNEDGGGSNEHHPPTETDDCKTPSDENSILDVDLLLCRGATMGRLDVVAACLEHPVNFRYRDPSGRGPLHFAAMGGSLEIVELLLDHIKQEEDPQLVNDLDAKGWSALLLAVVYGFTEITERLLDAGADPEGTIAHNCGPCRLSRPESPVIHFAALRGFPKIVSLLISRGISVNSPDSHNRTPLHYAVYRENAEVVQLLLQSGAFASARDTHLRTPLHSAAVSGQLNNCTALIEAGADTECEDIWDFSAASLARTSNHTDLATFLDSKTASKWEHNSVFGTLSSVANDLEETGEKDTKENDERTEMQKTAVYGKMDELQLSVAAVIVTGLQEPKVEKVCRAVLRLGVNRCLKFYEKTLQIERKGGMQTVLAERRRHPGGVFFTLIKEALAKEAAGGGAGSDQNKSMSDWNYIIREDYEKQKAQQLRNRAIRRNTKTTSPPTDALKNYPGGRKLSQNTADKKRATFATPKRQGPMKRSVRRGGANPVDSSRHRESQSPHRTSRNYKNNFRCSNPHPTFGHQTNSRVPFCESSQMYHPRHVASSGWKPSGTHSFLMDACLASGNGENMGFTGNSSNGMTLGSTMHHGMSSDRGTVQPPYSQQFHYHHEFADYGMTQLPNTWDYNMYGGGTSYPPNNIAYQY